MTIFTETTVYFDVPRDEEEHRKFIEQMGEGWVMSGCTSKSIAYSHITRVWRPPTEEEKK